MILRHEAIEERFKELDTIMQELGKYGDISWDAFNSSLSQQWIVERGLIAAASLIFDVADHILAGHFGDYAQTYGESLTKLHERGVLTAELSEQIKGLGGFRNILIHAYLEIDPQEVYENYHKALKVFPQYIREVLAWLKDTGG
jgi:uncharacterized protein YutE (UPF0331/DUF86 family)